MQKLCGQNCTTDTKHIYVKGTVVKNKDRNLYRTGTTLRETCIFYPEKSLICPAFPSEK